MDDKRPPSTLPTMVTSDQLAKELGITRVSVLEIARQLRLGRIHDDGDYGFDAQDVAQIRAVVPLPWNRRTLRTGPPRAC